jgi:IS5 family transposase
MARRELGQFSLADGLVSGVQGNRRLERLSGLVDWAGLDHELDGVYSSSRGRPGYPPLCLFKCLLLQQWYRLSDPELEEALADRLSFRRFVGLSLSDRVPDHSTISRFRTLLAERGLGEELFSALHRQLNERGLLVKAGTMIDATVVQADAVPLPHERAAERSDQDAGFTLTRRGYRLGYKAHLAVDCESRLIRTAILTPANVNDANENHVYDLIQGDEQILYADKAYDTGSMRWRLDHHGIANGILQKRWSSKPLSKSAIAANIFLSKRRVAIESLFGIMKRSYGYARVRYRTLSRNAVQLHLLCMALNMRRMVVLTA